MRSSSQPEVVSVHGVTEDKSFGAQEGEWVSQSEVVSAHGVTEDKGPGVQEEERGLKHSPAQYYPNRDG